MKNVDKGSLEELLKQKQQEINRLTVAFDKDKYNIIILEMKQIYQQLSEKQKD